MPANQSTTTNDFEIAIDTGGGVTPDPLTGGVYYLIAVKNEGPNNMVVRMTAYDFFGISDSISETILPGDSWPENCLPTKIGITQSPFNRLVLEVKSNFTDQATDFYAQVGSIGSS